MESQNISELHATDRLPEYVRGDLAEAQRAEVDHHLASCHLCREELQILEALASAPAPRLETADVARLYQPLHAGRASWWRVGVWRAAAGIAIVLTSYGIWLASQAGRDLGTSWSADAAIEGWDADLAELRPEALELRVALGTAVGPEWPEVGGEGLNGLAEINGWTVPWEDPQP